MRQGRPAQGSSICPGLPPPCPPGVGGDGGLIGGAAFFSCPGGADAGFCASPLALPCGVPGDGLPRGVPGEGLPRGVPGDGLPCGDLRAAAVCWPGSDAAGKAPGRPGSAVGSPPWPGWLEGVDCVRLAGSGRLVSPLPDAERSTSVLAPASLPAPLLDPVSAPVSPAASTLSAGSAAGAAFSLSLPGSGRSTMPLRSPTPTPTPTVAMTAAVATDLATAEPASALPMPPAAAEPAAAPRCR